MFFQPLFDDIPELDVGDLSAGTNPPRRRKSVSNPTNVSRGEKMCPCRHMDSATALASQEDIKLIAGCQSVSGMGAFRLILGVRGSS
jgi:hypothetical protein